MEVRHEKFRVRKPTSASDLRNDVVRDPADPSSVDIALKFTRHGPVLWDDGRRALALRWVGNEPGTAGYLASLAIDRAQNWDQFESAAGRWKVPSENLVYADIEGNIFIHRDRCNEKSLKDDRQQRIDQNRHHDERNDGSPIAENFAQFFLNETLQSAKEWATRGRRHVVIRHACPFNQP